MINLYVEPPGGRFELEGRLYDYSLYPGGLHIFLLFHSLFGRSEENSWVTNSPVPYVQKNPACLKSREIQGILSYASRYIQGIFPDILDMRYQNSGQTSTYELTYLGFILQLALYKTL